MQNSIFIRSLNVEFYIFLNIIKRMTKEEEQRQSQQSKVILKITSKRLMKDVKGGFRIRKREANLILT